jgi:hypothetical protein
MTEAKSARVWALVTFIVVAGSLASLIETTGATVPPCADNADCNCSPQQELENCDPASGAGGLCVGGMCECNPGFGGENCDPTVPQGGECELTSQCEPGLFCVDRFCCNEPCTGPNESCNDPGREGTCVTPAAGAPAVSPFALMLLIVVLACIGGIALLRPRPSR